MVLVIALEGNIGAGKSTLLEKIRDVFGKYGIKFYCITEPVQEWKDMGTLGLFYGDKKRNGFLFQTHVLLTRFNKIYDKLKQYDENTVVFIERSAIADVKCFVEVNYKNGDINEVEYKVLLMMYETLIVKLYPGNVNHMIYVKTPVEECLKRINIRNRTEEIELEWTKYLSQLEKAHDELAELYLDKNKIIIDGMIDFKNDGKNINIIIEKIYKMVEDYFDEIESAKQLKDIMEDDNYCEYDDDIDWIPNKEKNESSITLLTDNDIDILQKNKDKYPYPQKLNIAKSDENIMKDDSKPPKLTENDMKLFEDDMETFEDRVPLTKKDWQEYYEDEKEMYNNTNEPKNDKKLMKN